MAQSQTEQRTRGEAIVREKGETESQPTSTNEVVAASIETHLAEQSDKQPETAGTDTLRALADGRMENLDPAKRFSSPIPKGFEEGLGDEIADSLNNGALEDNSELSERNPANTDHEATEPAPETQKTEPLTPVEVQKRSIDALTAVAENTKDPEGVMLLAREITQGKLAPELVADVQHYLTEHAQQLTKTETVREREITLGQQKIADRLQKINQSPLERGQEGYQKQQIERSRLEAEHAQLSEEQTAIQSQKEDAAADMLALSEQASLLTETDELVEETTVADISTENTDHKETAEQTPTNENNLPDEINSELELFERNIDKLSLEQLRAELERTEGFRKRVDQEKQLVAIYQESTVAMLEMNQEMQSHYDTLIDHYTNEENLEVPKSLLEGRDKVIQTQTELNQRHAEITIDAKLLEALDTQAKLYQESIESRIDELETTNKKAGYNLPPGVFDLISENAHLREKLMQELSERKKKKNEAPRSLIEWFFLLLQLRKK